jgi:hypothetical protein
MKKPVDKQELQNQSRRDFLKIGLSGAAGLWLLAKDKNILAPFLKPLTIARFLPVNRLI